MELASSLLAQLCIKQLMANKGVILSDVAIYLGYGHPFRNHGVYYMEIKEVY